MSTINPDERDGRVARVLQPAAKVAALLVQFLAPVMFVLWLLGVLPPDGGYILLYVLVWVAAGLLALFTLPGVRNTYLIAAYILFYIGGLFATIAMTVPEDDFDAFILIMIGGPYLVGIAVLAFYALRENAMKRTREIGVDTTATVVSAPVTGMVNYVTRQRLTLRFTDQQGVERFVRVGRTGGGYAPGDTVPIRYDPTRPWYKRGILVEGSGPTLFGGRRWHGGGVDA
jgi:hypothetical protein